MQKIVIVGSGPAGCAVAFFLAKAKIPHVLIEKAAFPRPKVCGDGLAPKAVMMLERMQKGLSQELFKTEKAEPVFGGRIFSPAGFCAELYLKRPEKGHASNAFSILRRDFDDFLQKQLDPTFSQILTETEVKKIDRKGAGFELLIVQNGIEKRLEATILIGCDGDRSIVKKTLAPQRLDPEHYDAGIRTYFSNVAGCSPDNLFELYFLKSLLPGYLWIFPLADGRANVGLAMTSADVSRKKANLRKMLETELAQNSLFRDRFANAEMIGKVEGWGLPLGSKMGILSGEGFLLAGDAASLIDPLTGEGVGNALYSGWLAAESVEKAVITGRRDAAFFQKTYDRRVFKTMQNEMRFNRFWNLLFRWPRLIDHLFLRMGRNPVIQQTINVLFDPVEFRKKRFNPVFWGRFFWTLIF